MKILNIWKIQIIHTSRNHCFQYCFPQQFSCLSIVRSVEVPKNYLTLLFQELQVKLYPLLPYFFFFSKTEGVEEGWGQNLCSFVEQSTVVFLGKHPKNIIFFIVPQPSIRSAKSHWWERRIYWKKQPSNKIIPLPFQS